MTKSIDSWLQHFNATLWASSRKADAITDAKDYVSSCVFGTKYNKAVALVTAHLLALDTAGEGTDNNPNSQGVIKKEKEDRIEIEYATGSGDGSETEQWYKQTNYGSRFLQLRKQVKFMPRVRGMGCN